MKEYDDIKTRSAPALATHGVKLAQNQQTKHLAQMEVDQKTLLTFVNNSLESLISTIKDSDKKNEALGWKMFWLAIVGLILAATQIIPAIDILRQWFKWW